MERNRREGGTERGAGPGTREGFSASAGNAGRSSRVPGHGSLKTPPLSAGNRRKQALSCALFAVI